MRLNQFPLRRRARTWCLVFVALGSLGLLASGCSSSSQSGTIDGHLVVTGGTVQLNATGHPESGARPVSGDVTATNTAGKSVRIATAPNGVFAMQLPPGAYAVTGTSQAYESGKSTCPTGGGAVRVLSGHRTTVVISCDER